MADITVDLWQDFDFTTLNTTNLAANDHASVGIWTIADPDSQLSTSTSGEKISTGLISGNSDSGGTRGLALTPPSPASNNTAVYYEFSEEKASASYGFWYQFPAAFIGSDDEHDILYVANAAGTHELYIKQTSHEGPGAGKDGWLFLYTGETEYSAGIDISGMAGEWIWITAQHNTGGAGSPHRLRAYDVDGNQIGSEQTRTSNTTNSSHTVSMGSEAGALQGHSGSVYFDDFVIDWTDATFPLGPPLSTGTVDQEGFWWGVDDGSESAHTFETGSQDTNITIVDDQSRLLRVLLDGTDDPGNIAYTLRVQKNGSGGYTAVPIGASTTTTPVIEVADVLESGNNTATTSWAVAYPAYVSGDLLVFHVASDADVTHNWSATGPNGETVNTIIDSTGGTAQRASGFWFVGSATTGAGTFTVTPSATEQWTACVIKVPAGEFNSTTPVQTNIGTANDTSADTSWATPAWNSDATASGKIVVFAAHDVVTTNAAPGGWTALITRDRGAVGCTLGVRDAANTASESIASANFTNVSSETDSSFGYVINAPVVTNEVYITTSANITAGGEATTARLTAPTGKTTSDFTTGRRWDNENGSDSIDIATDFYTEVEWLVYIASSAATDDFFDFRVYAGSNALDSYSVTPRWTIGTGSITGSLSKTLGTITLDADGTLTITGSFSKTLGILVLDSDGALAITGSFDKTLGVLTLEAEGATGANSGTLSKTLGILTSVGTGLLAISGTVSKTLGSLTLSGLSTLTIVGTLTKTLGAVILSAAGGAGITGTVTKTLDALTAASTGALAITASLAQTFGNLVLASSASLGITGALNKTLGLLTLFGREAAPATGFRSKVRRLFTYLWRK